MAIKALPVNGVAIFDFKNESEARGTFACEAKTILTALDRWNCYQAIVRIPGENDLTISTETVRLMAEFSPVVQLFFADVSLPAIVLRASVERLESDSRWGIVRLHDERQVVMSSGMSGVLLAGVGIDETTQWRRPEYWERHDLDAFNQLWRERLSEDGSNTLEHRYRIHKPNSSDPWEYYRSDYRLLRGEDSLLYQLCTFVDRG